MSSLTIEGWRIRGTGDTSILPGDGSTALRSGCPTGRRVIRELLAEKVEADHPEHHTDLIYEEFHVSTIGSGRYPVREPFRFISDARPVPEQIDMRRPSKNRT